MHVYEAELDCYIHGRRSHILPCLNMQSKSLYFVHRSGWQPAAHGRFSCLRAWHGVMRTDPSFSQRQLGNFPYDTPQGPRSTSHTGTRSKSVARHSARDQRCLVRAPQKHVDGCKGSRSWRFYVQASERYNPTYTSHVLNRPVKGAVSMWLESYDSLNTQSKRFKAGVTLSLHVALSNVQLDFAMTHPVRRFATSDA